MAKHPTNPPDSLPDAGGPWRRWSRRKAQHRRATRQQPVEVTAVPEPDNGEADLPSLDALDEYSELSAFFAEGVSERLRRSALRKVFHLQKYNSCDGLDDYAEDYTRFQPLGDIMTARLRLRHEHEQLKRALTDAAQDAKPAVPGTERSGTDAPEPAAEAQASPRDESGEPQAET